MKGLILLQILLMQLTNGLRLRGTFNTSDFFIFLAKFGFQKTDVRNTRGTEGFIFGNVTSSGSTNDESESVALAVLDRGYFLEYYGNRSLPDKDSACRRMFDKVSSAAYDSDCFDDGEQDFLRTVPCPKDSVCQEEDDIKNVVKGFQLTYRLQDSIQPRFWYVTNQRWAWVRFDA